MVRRGVIGINTTLLSILIGCLIFQRSWLAICLLLAVLSGMTYLWKERQKEYQNELSAVSDSLEKLLEKKEILYEPTQDDTLVSKIRFQIQRIQNMYAGVTELAEKERDGIKKLLAELAHQLRTPLANLETYIAILEDEKMDSETRMKYFEKMEHVERKLHFLLEEFLKAARLEHQIIQIRKCESDLKETAAQAVFQVYQKAKARSIHITLSEEKTGILVPHDRNWLCEAIYNLLDNSIKYSPEESEVNIILNSNEMFSEIRIEDNGIGIEPGEESRIFQLYYRGTRVSGQEGFGMGVFIAREIVRRHDGFVKVKRKNPGLIVSIILPKAGT